MNWIVSMVKKFRKNHNVGLIQKKKTYTVREIAELLSIHVRTVHSWLKQGLSAHRETTPYYVVGSDLYDYLKREQTKRKHPLQPNELFCSRCHNARQGVDSSYEVIITKKKLGQNAFQAIILARCVTCNQKMMRFSSDRQIPVLISQGLKVPLHHQVLEGYGVSPSNTDNKEVQ